MDFQSSLLCGPSSGWSGQCLPGHHVYSACEGNALDDIRASKNLGFVMKAGIVFELRLRL